MKKLQSKGLGSKRHQAEPLTEREQRPRPQVRVKVPSLPERVGGGRQSQQTVAQLYRKGHAAWGQRREATHRKGGKRSSFQANIRSDPLDKLEQVAWHIKRGQVAHGERKQGR